MPTDDERFKTFGFIEGTTVCNNCGKLLSKDDAFWVMGHWLCRFVKSCDEQKHIPTYEVYSNNRYVDTAHSSKEVWDLVGKQPFGWPYSVGSKSGDDVSEFIPF